jgi:hypothetical protein
MFETLRKYSLGIGIAAMTLATLATFSEPGSLTQRLLFLIAVPTLGFVAYLNEHKMFLSLQIVATISTILAFFILPQLVMYTIMIGSAAIATVYLIKINYSKQDPWWPLGGAGLISLAAGLATSAVLFPFIFFFLLALGGILIALYSAVGFFIFKVRIAAIWLFLNLIFAANPALQVILYLL